MTPEIAEAVGAADPAACLALRIAVFCDEQGVTRAEEIDGLDDTARHLLACVAGRPAGTLRLRREGAVAKIERVCIDRALRGKGIGAALVDAALRLAATDGAAEARLGAQIALLGFYERLGFVAEGPEYLDARIPHRAMARPLP